MRRFPYAAVFVSILLHVGIVALGLLTWRQHATMGSAVPVTIVSGAEFQAPDIAPVPTPAEAPPVPTPAPPAEPPPPAPAETAKPEPAKPVDSKLPTPKPQKAAATPSKTPSDCSDILKCFGKVLGPVKPPAAAAGRPSATPKPAAAPKRAPTAAEARSALAGMVGKVEQQWVLDCDTVGTRDVVAPVRFTIGSDGKVARGPELVNQGQNGVLVAQAARAAVKAAAPYSLADVPADYRNQEIQMNFSAKEACSKR